MIFDGEALIARIEARADHLSRYIKHEKEVTDTPLLSDRIEKLEQEEKDLRAMIAWVRGLQQAAWALDDELEELGHGSPLDNDQISMMGERKK